MTKPDWWDERAVSDGELADDRPTAAEVADTDDAEPCPTCERLVSAGMEPDDVRIWHDHFVAAAVPYDGADGEEF